jgi:hypothetical protein
MIAFSQLLPGLHSWFEADNDRPTPITAHGHAELRDRLGERRVDDRANALKRVSSEMQLVHSLTLLKTQVARFRHTFAFETDQQRSEVPGRRTVAVTPYGVGNFGYLAYHVEDGNCVGIVPQRVSLKNAGSVNSRPRVRVTQEPARL